MACGINIKNAAVHSAAAVSSLRRRSLAVAFGRIRPYSAVFGRVGPYWAVLSRIGADPCQIGVRSDPDWMATVQRWRRRRALVASTCGGGVRMAEQNHGSGRLHWCKAQKGGGSERATTVNGACGAQHDRHY